MSKVCDDCQSIRQLAPPKLVSVPVYVCMYTYIVFRGEDKKIWNMYFDDDVIYKKFFFCCCCFVCVCLTFFISVCVYAHV